MAIITIVRKYNTWGDGEAFELKKFISEGLTTFEGSEGEHGERADDPIAAAKVWAASHGYDNSIGDGDHILVIDTQSPPHTSTYAYCLFPEYKEENDYRLTWER